MKPLTLLVCLILLTIARGQAQPNLAILSSKKYVGVYNQYRLFPDEQQGYIYLRTADGGFIIGVGSPSEQSTCDSGGDNRKQRRFTKFSPITQEPEWIRCYDAHDTGRSGVHDLIPLANGDYALSRQFYRWGMQRTDGADNLIWSKNYEIYCELYSTRPTPDGGYIMYGQAIGTDPEVYVHYGAPFTYDIFLFKVDSLGNKVWGKVLGGSQNEFISRVIPLTDGGCYVIGGTQSPDYDATGCHAPSVPGQIYADGWVVRLDGAGNKLWHRCYGGSFSEYIHGSSLAENNSLYLLGYTESADGDVVGHVGTSDEYNVWLFKIDSTGEIIWQKCFLNSEPNPIYPWVTNYGVSLFSMEQDNQGQLWCTGYAYNQMPPFIDTVYDTLYNSTDGIVVRFDTLGNLTGRRVIGGPNITDQKENCLFAVPMPNGTVMAMGEYIPPIYNNPTLPDDTATTPTATYYVKLANWFTGVQERHRQELLIKAYPNPASEYLDIASSVSGMAILLSADGREVVPAQPVDGGATVRMTLRGLAPGIYYLRVMADNGQVGWKKVVVVE